MDVRTIDVAEAPFLVGIGAWLAAVQISIAASQILLAGLVLVWIARLFRGEARFAFLPLDRPLCLYAGASLAAALFSFDPLQSLTTSKKLLLLVVPYLLVSSVRRPEILEKLVMLVVLIADIAAAVGLWQYQFGELGDLNHRIHGFMGHYMTYSGQLMVVGTLSLAQLLFGRKPRWFWAASLTIILLALALTLTRSAWIGMIAAAAVVAFIRDRRLLFAIPAVGLIFFLVSPSQVERRFLSFLRPDTSGIDRIFMLESGWGMMANHPWLGVGPGNVEAVYPIYVPEGAPHRENPHLHNNLAQIGAERGILCLLGWIWLVSAGILWSARGIREASGSRDRALSVGALSVMVAALIAGLFEYNFGDSEFQMLYLFALAIPFILRNASRASDSDAARPAA